jgi:hypothetical protein
MEFIDQLFLTQHTMWFFTAGKPYRTKKKRNSERLKGNSSPYHHPKQVWHHKSFVSFHSTWTVVPMGSKAVEQATHNLLSLINFLPFSTSTSLFSAPRCWPKDPYIPKVYRYIKISIAYRYWERWLHLKQSLQSSVRYSVHCSQ